MYLNRVACSLARVTHRAIVGDVCVPTDSVQPGKLIPMARFSIRTAWDIRESDLANAVRLRRERGDSVLDLTLSNPTACGFDYKSLDLLSALQSPKSLVYDPNPRGLLSAREAVAGYYADHGAEVLPDQIILTTSTSEAYSFLFRVLCNAGDAVLTGQPGYPLFEFLATLDDVVLTTYPLFYDFGWWIDFAELERNITPRTRALVLVHPNNPTGHATRSEQRLKLEEICLRHDLALIVDEVFLDYPVAENSTHAGATFTRPREIESFACGPHPCLTFVVSGLSKICALPQMKVAWIAAFGADSSPDLDLISDRAEALNRLEVIADTFLSLNAPVQHALPTWLARRAIKGRVNGGHGWPDCC